MVGVWVTDAWVTGAVAVCVGDRVMVSVAVTTRVNVGEGWVALGVAVPISWIVVGVGVGVGVAVGVAVPTSWVAVDVGVAPASALTVTCPASILAGRTSASMLASRKPDGGNTMGLTPSPCAANVILMRSPLPETGSLGNSCVTA